MTESTFIKMLVTIGVTIAGVQLIRTVGPAVMEDRVTWCYVESGALGAFYRLRGHRVWRPDIDLGSYQTVPAMMEVASRIGCVWPTARPPADAGTNQP